MRGLPGAELLSEERADPRDAHPHAVPLPQLAGRGHSGLHSAPAGLPQVSSLDVAGPGDQWGDLREAPKSRGSGGCDLGSPRSSPPDPPGLGRQTLPDSEPGLISSSPSQRAPNQDWCSLSMPIPPPLWSSSVSSLSDVLLSLSQALFLPCLSV